MKKSLKSRREFDFRGIEKQIESVDDLEPEFVFVIYGPPGSGKTTLLGTFPKPLLVIDIGERGTDSIRKLKGVKVIRIRQWADFDRIYWYLKKTKHGFKSIGIDTVTGAQELSIIKALEKRGLEPLPGQVGGWGTLRKQDWGSISSDLKGMIFNFRELAAEQELNVAFLAHDKKEKGSDDEEEEEGDDAGIKPQVIPKLMPSVVSVLNGAVNVIGHTFTREHTKEIKLSALKKKKIKKVEYCLRLGPHSYYTTKVRKPRETEAPAFLIDPSYDDIIELIED